MACFLLKKNSNRKKKLIQALWTPPPPPGAYRVKNGVESFLCIMVKDINDSPGTVLNTFGPYLRDLLLKIWENIKNALTQWIFQLEKCVFLNGSEFCQKLIVTIIRVLVRDLCEYSSIKQWQKPLQGEVSHQSPVCPHPPILGNSED